MKTEPINVIVFHEYGAQNHYIGLEAFCSQNDYKISYQEFSFVRQLGKGIIRGDFSNFLRGINNLFFILKTLLFGIKNSKVVVGIAPYDWSVVLVYIMLRKVDYYLHTSWPFWSGGYTPKKKYKTLESIWESFVKNSKGVFAVSNAVKENFCETFNYPSQRISTVYHGLPDVFFSSLVTNINRDKKSILYVGRYDDSKGIDILDQLSEKLIDYKFNFVGYGNRPPIRRSNVKDYGMVNDKEQLIKIFSKNEILLLPSKKTKNWQEVFGIVIIEALACGTYPIVSNNIGPRELVNDNIGKVVDQENIVCSLEAELKKFEYLSANEKEKISDQAKKFARKYKSEKLAKHWSLINT